MRKTFSAFIVSACLLLPVTLARAQTATDQEERSKSAVELNRESLIQFREWQESQTDTALLQKSLETVREAIQADSTYSAAYAHMSYVLNALGDKPGAIAACKKGIELVEDDKGGDYPWLGNLYSVNGQREKALKTYKESILRDPSNSQFYGDTRYYIEQGDFTPEEIEEVLSLSEKHTGYAPLLKEPPRALERCAAAYKSIRGYRDTTTVEIHTVRQGMDNRATMSVPVRFRAAQPSQG